MKLVSVEQMRYFEKEANNNGLSYPNMMENAGSGLGKEIHRIAHSHIGEGKNIYASPNILGLVGPGNNGGDTLIALSYLSEQNFQVTAYLINRKSEDDQLLMKFNNMGGRTIVCDDKEDFIELKELIKNCDILVDGVLGTGIKLPLKSEIKVPLQNVKRILNELDNIPIVIAVDCPSGIDNDTGEVSEETISADFTFSMAALKQGLLKLPAFEFTGKLRTIDIGFNEKNSSLNSVKRQVADENLINSFKLKRPLDAHKGTFGTALIVAGSLNYTGAVLLAGKAAYRVGVGLVTLGIPNVLHAPLAGHFPEATWLLLPNEMGSIAGPAASVLMKNFDKANALLVGCGLGTEETTYDFFETFLCNSAKTKKNQERIGFVKNLKKIDLDQNYKIPPLVIDADGLNLLAKIPEWPKILPENTILTPHPGEMEALTGVSKEKIQANRLNVAEHFAKEWQQIVVLKGAFTIIASPDGSTTIIPVATPALARAGSGDVLAGMIVGYRAQGMDAYRSAIAGAWYHAIAGLLASKNMGGVTSIIAGDIIEAISGAISLGDSGIDYI